MGTEHIIGAAVIAGSITTYTILRKEISKYGDRIVTQKAHMASKWLPVWAAVYALAFPTAVVVRCIRWKKRT